MIKPPAAGRGEEPPMFLQRPSTGKSQDVRHLLAKTFRGLYTRDAIGPDTVKNLSISKGGDDPYHERYVESLQMVFEEHKKRLDEAAKLEKHIMQAQARAMSADERELNRVSKSCDNYADLGLPPGRSHFRSCIDSDLLQKHKLLVPEDYATGEPALVPPPSAPKIPSYARETVSSQQKIRGDSQVQDETPLLPAQHSKSDLDQPLPSYLSEDDHEEDVSSTGDDIERIPMAGWKLHLNEASREIDRNDLANLQAKINFKRNPRFVPPSASLGGRTLIKGHNPIPKEIGIQLKEDTALQKTKEPSVVFLVSPPVVEFRDYKVGQVYEITLELKNVSAVLRQCRALPPSSTYFSVGLGQFPGEHGLVAPGMSCHYAIRFAPDSLADYDDEIHIQTQSTNPIIVPLQGRREAPKISLPPEIHVGYSLVGGYHVSQFLLKNEGGNGRFCILPRSSWPATNFKSVVLNGSVSMPPFEVRPSVLELLKGETGVIEVIFSPRSVKDYSQDMTLVCDNCHVKHFTLKGQAQRAGVELVSVERGTTDAIPGELNDISAQHLVRFEDLNPFTYTDKGVTVKNSTNVQLPFQWMVYKPDMTDTSEDLDKKVDRIPDIDSVFSIHPPSGVLPPLEEMEFRVTFAPPVVDNFHSVLHLLLQQIPPYNEEGSAKSSKSSKSKEDGLQGDDSDDDTVSEIFLNSDLKQFRDVTAMELELKGTSIPLNVLLHPYAVYSPGQNLIGTTVKKLITMANHSRSTITFQWQPHHETEILEVEPPFGDLDPGMAMDMELSITGTVPGKIDQTLYCYVMNMEKPLHLHVEAEFKGPEVGIEEPDVNFGLVRLGQTVQREITLENKSQIIVQWTIQDSPGFRDIVTWEPQDEGEFTFSPSSGELLPLERKKVNITFIPASEKSVKRIFEVAVEKGNQCNIAAFAEVQKPTVCLSSCEICMSEVYKMVPVTYQAILLNQTLLPAGFKWGKPEGSHVDDCSIELDITEGLLKPREEKVIEVNFVANREGEYSDLRIPCQIEGMQKPLYLGLFCTVKGLSVSYRISWEGYTASKYLPDLHLEYGDVDLGDRPKMYLHICNESAIKAPFNLSMEYFGGTPPSPPDNKTREDGTMAVSQRRAMLGRTPNLADPMAKTPAKVLSDLGKMVLSKGLGASFVLNPPTGSLPPFGEAMIEITAFSDMWGVYTDNLICKIGELEDSSIPVSMTVAGCPLQFQMTTANPGQKPVMRFGTHVSGVATTNRTMRVNNTSPCDIRVDWQVYNIEDDDSKLLDLTATFGQAFPKLDDKGKELIPPWKTKKVPEPPKRLPTDFLPDSPRTSVASVRSVANSPVDPPPTEEEIMKKRKPIVSLFFRSHEGVQSESPYSIKTKQLVIPARSHANVNLTFIPFPTEMVSKEMDCTGYASAFMSLDGEKDVSVDGKVQRDQGYRVNPLRVDMTAHLKPALLSIECADEEGMRYRSAMSDLLLENGTTKAESLRVCSTILSNQTLTPLAFCLKTTKPFLLVDLDPTSNSEGLQRAHVTDMQTLRPQHNLLVKVAFQTTTDLLALQENQESTGDNDGSDVSNQEGRKIEVNDDLIIEFNNSAVQKVPLHATLSVPQVELSRESLDFGTCLVGQRRELQFLITNRTASHTFWTAKLSSCSDTCGMDTFTLEPSQGMLEAHITHVSNSKTLIQVFFTAKHADSYEGVFVFQGSLGEEPRKLYIRGQGSYDGKHEAILNV